MTEQPVQATLQFNDVNITLRYPTVAELLEAYAEVSKGMDELSSSLTEIKQTYLGKSVMTGTHTPSSPAPVAAAASPRSTPPPSSASPSNAGMCPGNEHHEAMPWKDTRFPDGTSGRTKAGEIMKFDLYCSFDPGKGADDWKKKCTGVAINPR